MPEETFGAFLYWAVRGLVLFDNLRRLGAFKSHLGMGLSIGCTDENSTLWRPCFLLVHLGVLKTDTHPWLIQLHPVVD